ncbi:hypothetical protein AGMMS49531_09400 [Endomicrobiia bacterium]|nr:hypothetical protein AGMMS49531_09400 [Endomicrobiia bacterium]
MKLKAILSVFVAFSLALSSCDKKNASLVNRRTATPEKIREVEERERVKTTPTPTPIPTLESLVSTIPNITLDDRTNLLASLNRLNLPITDCTNLVRVLSTTLVASITAP